MRRRLGVGLGLLALLAAPAFASGPPFPDPVPGQVVYDEADIFSQASEAEAAQIIGTIEARTGAEIVVYTQVKPGVSDEEAAADAQALGNQWGVGRAGFDDGLVILFDMETDGLHGAVQLQAGPGYRAAYLSDDERQALYETRMLPLLRVGRIGDALLAGLREIDAAATREHADRLEQARILNALLGLTVAPLVFLLLVGIAGLRWYRYGRDPASLDDASIHMPAPPPGLTPAGATLLMSGQSSPRTMTTALVDLASRGEVAFEPDTGLLGTKVSILLRDPSATDDPDVGRARRHPPGPAEHGLIGAVHATATDGRIDPDDFAALKGAMATFDDQLEEQLTDAGWFREPPRKVQRRWAWVGAAELILAVAAFGIGSSLPSSGLTLVFVALGGAGVATLFLSRVMPARTKEGARLFAWLSAYKRTLRKTLEQARSMTAVAASHAMPWVETPDQALVWGVALGLHDEVEEVLKRSVADSAEGAAPGAWTPAWYGSGGAARGPAGEIAPGLMSASAVPDLDGMFAALRSVGSSASSDDSSGFGGGGGFSGGSVGGRF